MPAGEGKTVKITLNVGGNNNGSRVNVTPPDVAFEQNDKIVVASNGAVVGTLEHNGTVFEGEITGATENEHLYFYFIGNKQGTVANGTTELTVNISDQSAELPVLSYAASNEVYTTSTTSFTAALDNQCALVKFTYSAGTTETVTVGGMKTVASVNFANPSITAMETETTGTITLHPDAQGNTVKWAILLPQPAVEVAPVTIGNDNNFTASVPAVTVDQYYVGDDNNGVMIESATSAGEHGYVDLGLPSGLLWATCNVGADSPEEYGGYFAWAETETKTNYSWDTYTYYGENNTTKYNRADGKTTLEPTDDVATVLWGDDWRMPTQAEWNELLTNTTHTKTTQDGVDGLLFTARNGNSSLFLPAAGYYQNGSLDFAGRDGEYWSNLLKTDYQNTSEYGNGAIYFYLSTRDEGSCNMSYTRRCYGLSVRAN